MNETSKIKYGYWRSDKPKIEGYSHELISMESEMILDQTNIDTLEALPFPGVDTLFKALKRTAERIPNEQALGTRVGDEYQWMTWQEVIDTSWYLSIGIRVLNLCPPFEAEGKEFSMIGIQSKNRKEWVLTNIAGMYSKVTTVALYDTLGQDAMVYICNQTELSTIAMSSACINNIATLKIEDAKGQNKMNKLKKIIVFD